MNAERHPKDINLLAAPLLLVTNYAITAAVVGVSHTGTRYGYDGLGPVALASYFLVPVAVVVSYSLLRHVLRDDDFSARPDYVAEIVAEDVSRVVSLYVLLFLGTTLLVLVTLVVSLN